MSIFFYLFLFVAVWLTGVITCRAFYKNSITRITFLIWAFAVVGCIYSAIELS